MELGSSSKENSYERGMGNAQNILVGKSEGKMPRPKMGCRWKDNTNIDDQEVVSKVFT
jgi:hypothetical protein